MANKIVNQKKRKSYPDQVRLGFFAYVVNRSNEQRKWKNEATFGHSRSEVKMPGVNAKFIDS
ncbi:MAG: hypothetical protein Fur0010_04910 [Bdellovibrio sp.]